MTIDGGNTVESIPGTAHLLTADGHAAGVRGHRCGSSSTGSIR